MIIRIVLIGGRNRRELETGFSGTPGEVMHDALAVALLVVILPLISILRSLGQHRVDEASKLMGGSGDRLGPVQTRTQATVISPQR